MARPPNSRLKLISCCLSVGLLPTVPVLAQRDPQQEPLPIRPSSVVVSVRELNGAPLEAPAFVHIYSPTSTVNLTAPTQERGQAVFNGAAKCATCHVPPLFTEPGWNMHAPADIGVDDFQSGRSPDKKYRTTPLKGAWARAKGGYYHDGRFATLSDVVAHYDTTLGLGLSAGQKSDLVEYLKSL